MIGLIAIITIAAGCIALIAIAHILDHTSRVTGEPSETASRPTPAGRLLPLPTLIIECDDCPGWDELYDTAFTTAHHPGCQWNWHNRVQTGR